MLKPAELRQAVTSANPHLARDPDKLQVFIDSGRIVCAGGASLSFEYQYTINLIVQDYPGHADAILLPMLAWLRTNQPELFENVEKRNQGIRFEAEFINQGVMDLSIEVDLTERVIVAPDPDAGNRLVAEHVGEPPHPEFPIDDWTLEVIDRRTDTLLATFTFPGWRPVL